MDVLTQYSPEELDRLLALATPEERAQIDLLLLPSKEELESDWRVWLKTLFPQFVRGELAPYHIEYWDWLWANLMAKRRGEPVPDGNAFLAIWGRGCAKTTMARLAPIAEAAILKDGFCIYCSMTQSQSNVHLDSIKQYLDGSNPKFPNTRLRYYYPEICTPKLSTAAKGVAGRATWNQQKIRLHSGYVIQAVGLDTGVRGANEADVRATMIVPDDLDTRSDSVLESEQKMDTFLHSVLPTKQPGTITICAQNLVIEHGVFNRIVTGQVPAFATARFSGPHPRVLNPKTEVQEYNGRQRTVLIGGTPSWPAQTLEQIQEDIDDWTWPVFQREAQHQLQIDKTGLVLSSWEDEIHVITEDEFASVFGVKKIPRAWNKEILHDWAKSKSAYHANVALKVAVSSQNEKLPGCLFIFDPMSFEENTQADDVAIRILESISPTVDVHGIERTWKEILDAELARAHLENFVTNTTALLAARRALLARVIPPLVGPLLRRHNYKRLRMSHEAKDQRNVYRRVFGLNFTGVNPRKEGGIEFANHYFRVYKDRPHPFKPGVMGWAQMYVVVPNHKKEYPLALRPDELHDHDLLRYQFAHWRHTAPNLTTTGILEHGPEKMNDDMGQALQMGMLNGGLLAEPLTYNEQVEEVIAPELRAQNLLHDGLSLMGRQTMTASQQMSYFLARERAQQQIQRRRQAFDEYGDPIG